GHLPLLPVRQLRQCRFDFGQDLRPIVANVLKIDPLVARLRSVTEEGVSVILDMMFDAAVRIDRQPFLGLAAAADGDDPAIVAACKPSRPACMLALFDGAEAFGDASANVCVCVVMVAPLSWAAPRVKNQRGWRESQ